ncbi:hypothetical protein P153DRAFT_184429 [Dothidotthia symphoricarpi CBS 119687]|uniref:Uncharacterized protein n=1 Tax=Dothidotthia symphoricarpi CBS 119687 TaxID=1392245 RepID=A0A6A6AJY2_9PLEO|nr:uncharacterized protein P153DRAFT_184429 [Dothidotthia symphoricarpi CBS 119687]KAF2132110.1 hypothetical protein P153DRAFT_184429 [Dothidotthia symphoricarpi CBS 119687]
MECPPPQLLFPALPPELRNEVYTHLSTGSPSTPPTTAGIPLQLKTHVCKHTRVQISAVHHGCAALLALPVQEAREYSAHLLSQVELRIGIVFRGRGQTFVQSDWDARMAAHLKKLAKRYRWLEKVARYEVHVLWDAADGVLRSKGGKRTVGGVVRGMVRTVTGLKGGDVRGRRGDLRVCLRVEDWIAVERARSGVSLGLGDFLVEEQGWDGQRREVWMESRSEKINEAGCGEFVPVPSENREEKALLVAEGESVDWMSLGKAKLVMRKDVEPGNSVEVTLGDTSDERGADTSVVLRALVEECMGRG